MRLRVEWQRHLSNVPFMEYRRGRITDVKLARFRAERGATHDRWHGSTGWAATCPATCLLPILFQHQLVYPVGVKHLMHQQVPEHSKPPNSRRAEPLRATRSVKQPGLRAARPRYDQEITYEQPSQSSPLVGPAPKKAIREPKLRVRVLAFGQSTKSMRCDHALCRLTCCA